MRVRPDPKAGGRPSPHSLATCRDARASPEAQLNCGIRADYKVGAVPEVMLMACTPQI